MRVTHLYRATASIGWKALAAASLAGAFSVTARAGTILDTPGVTPSDYVNEGAKSEYQAVGKINGPAGYATATLISSRWILTAAHVVDNNHDTAADGSASSYTFAIGGNTYTGTQIQFAPGWNGFLEDGRDLVLVKLSGPVSGVAASEIYAGSGELGSIFTMVGFGDTGTGTSGANSSDGLKRAGTNIFDRFTSFSTTHNEQHVTANATTIDSATATGLVWDFDKPNNPGTNYYPSSNATALEYAGANHDSGAPEFISVGGNPLVAGVVSDAIGGQTTYGAVIYGSRVSAYKDWIDDTTANVWTGSVSSTFATAGNWSDAAAPGVYDIARFNGASGATPYSVALGAEVENRKLLVQKGQVALDLGGHTYSLNALNQNGSVTVGRSSGDSAALTISNGTLSSVDAFIGAQSGATGAVVLSGAGAGSHWALSDSLYIGGSNTGRGGVGSVVVNTNATLSAAAIKVWRDGTLELAGGQASAATLSVEGTLLFSGAAEVKDRIGDNTAIVLDGGAVSRNSPASIRVGGLSEVTGLVVDGLHPNGIDTGTHGLGALTLASNSVIDFGLDNSALSILHFASLTATAPGGLLFITNWDGNLAGGGIDQLRFDTSIAGLIDFGQIRFFNSIGESLGSASQIPFAGYYEIVPYSVAPVPEPATWIAAWMLGAFALGSRKRLHRGR